MKKLLALLLLTASYQASAAMIKLDVSGAQDALNSPLTLSAILDVNEGDGETLSFSSFAMDVLFDNSLFSYMDGSISSLLPMGVVSQKNDSGVGVAYFNFGDVMIASDTTLFSLQLTALSPGTSTLSVMVNEMYSGGFMTQPMPVTLAQSSASQQVTVAQSVPVPQTLGLFALALGLLVARRRTR